MKCVPCLYHMLPVSIHSFFSTYCLFFSFSIYPECSRVRQAGLHYVPPHKSFSSGGQSLAGWPRPSQGTPGNKRWAHGPLYLARYICPAYCSPGTPKLSRLSPHHIYTAEEIRMWYKSMADAYIKNRKFYYGRRCIAMNPSPTIPLTSNTSLPLFSPLPEVVLEVLAVFNERGMILKRSNSILLI